MDGTGAIKVQRIVCMAAGQGPCGTVMGGEAERLGWRTASYAKSVALGSRVLLPDHHPACFVPVPCTRLIPDTEDVLCHLNSRSPKTFLSVLLSRCLPHPGTFSSLCLLENFSSSLKILLKCWLLLAALPDCPGRHGLSHIGELGWRFVYSAVVRPYCVV